MAANAIVAVIQKLNLKLSLCTDKEFVLDAPSNLIKLLQLAVNPNEDVQNALVDAFQHIITRIKHMTSFKPPALEILTLMIRKGIAPFQRNMASLFWKLAQGRLATEQNWECLKVVFKSFRDIDPSALPDVLAFVDSSFSAVQDVDAVPTELVPHLLQIMADPHANEDHKLGILSAFENKYASVRDVSAVSPVAFLMFFTAAYCPHDRVSTRGSQTSKQFQSFDVGSSSLVLHSLFQLWIVNDVANGYSINLATAIVNKLCRSIPAVHYGNGENAFALIVDALSRMIRYPRVMDAVMIFMETFCAEIKSAATPDKAEIYLQRLKDIILDHLKASEISLSLRGAFYIGLGKVMARLPFEPRLLEFFFQASENESAQLQGSLQEGLSWSLSAASQIPDDVLSRLLDTLHDHEQPRFVLQALNRMYPFSNAKVRFLNAISSDESSDSGLDITSFRGSQAYPSFDDFVSYVGRAVSVRGVVTVTTISRHRLLKMVRFAWRCARAQGLPNLRSFETVATFARLCTTLLTDDLHCGRMLHCLADAKLLTGEALSEEDWTAFLRSVASLFGLHDHYGCHTLTLMMNAMAEVMPNKFIEEWNVMRNRTFETILTQRRFAPGLLQLLSASLRVDSELVNRVFALFQYTLASASRDVHCVDVPSGVDDRSVALHIAASETYLRCVSVALYDMLKANSRFSISPALLQRVLTALNAETIPLVLFPVTQSILNTEDTLLEDELSAYLQPLFKLLKQKRDDLEELSRAFCLIAGGRTCSLYFEDYFVSDSQQGLKFAPDEYALESVMRAKETASSISTETSVMLPAIEFALTEMAEDPRGFMRRQSAMLLNYMIEWNARCPSVKRNLLRFQAAFLKISERNASADSDDVVGDLCSAGLANLFRIAETGDRKILVDHLTSQLLGTAKPVESRAVDEDAELMPSQALGKAPTGKTLSSYRDLCEAATDLGQPQLIYQFLALSSHHRKWKATEQAAQNTFMILSLGEESVRREFLKILPRIYRYKFDPASKVGSVMSEVWNALIEDPRTVFSSPTVVADLCRELISNADSRVWRVREAVLGGFEDLAHNVIDWNCVSPYVEDLFRISNILTDDIKETVRKAAVKAASSVNAAMVRWSESSEPALRKCMQILLDNSNRVNAKKTLEKLLSSSASKRPELVRDFISRLIPIMLESLSSEESADMNYAQFHAESMLNVTKEDMESLRLEAARTSPPQRVIDSLLPLLNDSIVTELCGFVYETIRSGVGLVTRVSCAKLILHCIKFHPAGVREAGPAKLIKVFLNSIESDRSKTAQKYYIASACALLKTASTKTVEKTVVDMLDRMFRPTVSADNREIVALFIAEIYRQRVATVTDRYNSDLLIVAFILKNASVVTEVAATENADEKTSDLSAHVWDENIQNPGSGVRIFLSEIVKWCSRILDECPDWVLKRCAARAVIESANYGKADVGLQISSILQMLAKSLQGSMWDGKHLLVDAVDAVVTQVLPWEHAKEEWAWKSFPVEGASVCQTLFDMVLAVCNRRQTAFLLAGLRVLQHLTDRFGPLVLSPSNVDRIVGTFRENSKIMISLGYKQSTDEDSVKPSDIPAIKALATLCIQQAKVDPLSLTS